MFCEVFSPGPCSPPARKLARFACGGVPGWGVPQRFIIAVTEMIWAPCRSNHLTLIPSLPYSGVPLISKGYGDIESKRRMSDLRVYSSSNNQH